MAYEGKVLIEKLKAGGLEVAEDAAHLIADSVFDWLQDSAKESESTLDDLLVPVIELAKPHVKAELDKIDGQPG